MPEPAVPGNPNGAPPLRGPGGDAAFTIEHVHRLRFTRDVFDPGNPVLRDLVAAAPGPGRAVVFVDSGVLDASPDLPQRVRGYAAACPDVLDLAGAVASVPGGERAKNDWSVFERVAAAIDEAGICRHAFVLAVGGGAVLDAVGFAAATAHRGVRLIRFPTTTLAQGDGGLGVKNGINAFGKKNFLGTFSVPWAVVNDEQFLTTLPNRDWRAGLSEAVKVALLKDASFFRHIADSAERLRQRDEAVARPIIRRAAELHYEHIVAGGDPFEAVSARPLDFGHWSAHKLEQESGFRVRHGEAVAVGIALDVVYSSAVGRLRPAEADTIIACLTDLGLNVYDDRLADHAAILGGLEEFREHLGGRLAITLLEGIGRPVDVHEIEAGRMVEAMKRFATCAERRAAG